MTDLVPRIDTVTAAERIGSIRPVAAVAPVEGAGATGKGSSGQEGLGADAGTEQRRQMVASMADYTRIRERISKILTDMRGGATQASADLDGMASVESVVVPLPPVSTDMLKMAEQVARAMAERVRLARAAQANADPASVSQIMASAD